MTTPAGSSQESGTQSEKDRRSGQDRRQGDRRQGDRRDNTFGGVGHKGGGFFENRMMVVGTILFGVLVGMVIMKLTTTPSSPAVNRASLPSGGIDVIVKPAAEP